MTSQDDPPAPPTTEPAPDDLYRWLTRIAAELDVDAEVLDVDRLLDLSRDVSHVVVRPAVPVTAFLLGYAVRAGGGDRAQFDAAVRRVWALTREWPQGG